MANLVSRRLPVRSSTIHQRKNSVGTEHPCSHRAPGTLEPNSGGRIMDRSLFVRFVATGLLTLPFDAVAQSADARMRRVAVMFQGVGWRPAAFFRHAMMELGYNEGQTLVIETRAAQGDSQRFPSLIAELIATKPEVIVVETTPGALAAKRATSTIPIVFISVSDPVGSGLVDSLARPGGNVTGATDLGSELAEKSVELIRAVVPKAARLGVLMSDNPVHPSQFATIRAAADRVSLSALSFHVASFDDLERAFSAMVAQKVDAFIPLGGSPLNSTTPQVDMVIALAAKARLPAVYGFGDFVKRGGLMSYGTNGPPVEADGHVRRPDSQRRQACGSAGSTADGLRAFHQSQDRRESRNQDPSNFAGARRVHRLGTPRCTQSAHEPPQSRADPCHSFRSIIGASLERIVAEVRLLDVLTLFARHQTPPRSNFCAALFQLRNAVNGESGETGGLPFENVRIVLERSPLVVELAGAPSSGPAIARSDSPRAPPVCCWRAAGPASGGRGPRAPATDALVERLRSFSSEVKWCRPRPARLPNI